MLKAHCRMFFDDMSWAQVKMSENEIVATIFTWNVKLGISFRLSFLVRVSNTWIFLKTLLTLWGWFWCPLLGNFIGSPLLKYLSFMDPEWGVFVEIFPEVMISMFSPCENNGLHMIVLQLQICVFSASIVFVS